MKKMNAIAMLLALLYTAGGLFAQTMRKETTVEVGGAAMYPSKTIVANAMNSKDHTTLVAAVKAAGLVETLNSAGPFTVFAPTNAAFNMLPKETVDNLMKPENKAALANVLTYHVVAGKLDAAALDEKIKSGGTLNTVAGRKLWVMKKDGNYWLKDESGGMAQITIKNVYQSNGVIHVIDHVLLPKSE